VRSAISGHMVSGGELGKTERTTKGIPKSRRRKRQKKNEEEKTAERAKMRL